MSNLPSDWATAWAWLQAIDTRTLTPAFDIFKEPEVAIRLSAAMAAAAALILIWLVFSTLPMWWRLRRLNAFVKTHNRDRQKFFEAYPAIDERMQNLGFISHAWREFVETLIFRDDPHAPIRNTVRPQLYINAVAAESSGKSLRFFHHIPNYFVGFGLLFTFIGLVAAIYFASQSVASPDVQAAQEALKNLLSAATFKFMTSIVGLASSIVLSFSYRLAIERLQVQFDRLCELLERGMLFATRESIAFDQLVELKEQTKLQQRFNADFAIEVGKVLEERMRGTMTDSLSEVMKPLREALERMTGNVGEMNQKAITDMANDFRESLKGSAGKEMEALAGTLKQIQESLGNVVEKIDKSGGDLGSRIEQSAAKMDELLISAGARLGDSTKAAADAFATKLETASNGMGTALAPLVDQLGRFGDTVDQLDEKLARQRTAFEDVAERVREITTNVKGTIEELNNAATPLRGVADRIGAAAEEFLTAGTMAADTHTGLQQVSENLKATVASMEKAWGDYNSRFESVDKNLAGAIDKLTTGADAFRQRISDFVTELDKQMDKSIRNLIGGVRALEETIEELNENKKAN